VPITKEFQKLVLIPVSIVESVAMTIVDVVNMIAVGNCYVTTPGAVLMVVILMDGVRGSFTFVPVSVMLPMQMPVVNIVGVVTVRNCYVTTVGAVLVGMVFVNGVRHGILLLARRFLLGADILTTSTLPVFNKMSIMTTLQFRTVLKVIFMREIETHHELVQSAHASSVTS